MPFCHIVLKREKGVLNWDKDNGQIGILTYFAPIFAPEITSRTSFGSIFAYKK